MQMNELNIESDDLELLVDQEEISALDLDITTESPATQRKPLFPKDTLHSTLLSVLGGKTPPVMDVTHLNLSSLKDADRSMWSERGVRYLLGRVRAVRGAFVAGMEAAYDEEQLTRLCSRFTTDLDNWLDTLGATVMKMPGYTRRVRKATAMELSHRRKGLLYRLALQELARKPTVGGLIRVRRALKELWYVVNIGSWRQ